MKYSISTHEDGRIIAINRWKPIRKSNSRKKNNDSIESYQIPEGIEFISEEKYKELCSRKDLPYIKWIGGIILEEDSQVKENRIAAAQVRVEEKQKNKVKNLLKELDGYVTLTSKGKKLLAEK